MTRTNTVHTVTLNAKQIATLAELSQKHSSVAHVWELQSGIIEVEFEFPYRYVLASNGRAIYTGA